MNISAVSVGGAVTAVPVAAAVPKQGSSPQSQTGGDIAVSGEQVRKMVDDMQSQIDKMNVSLQFYTYGDHGEKVAVVVTDKETGEVIREIPSKEIQELYSKMSELAGMILNGSA
jgi:flagellar protein FlaG